VRLRVLHSNLTKTSFVNTHLSTICWARVHFLLRHPVVYCCLKFCLSVICYSYCRFTVVISNVSP